MIDRILRAASALLILVTVGCTADELSVQTVVPASPEPFDLASLNGKVIEVQTIASGDFSIVPPRGTDRFRVVGKTIIWGGSWQKSRCVLNGTPYGERLAVLFTPDRPRSEVKVPCEGERRFILGGFIASSPSDVRYSSAIALQGNSLELTGELREHSFETNEKDRFTVTEDVTERLHARFRLSADKCQVLDFSWTTEVHGVHSSVGRPYAERRSERATGCSIVTPPS